MDTRDQHSPSVSIYLWNHPRFEQKGPGEFWRRGSAFSGDNADLYAARSFLSAVSISRGSPVFFYIITVIFLFPSQLFPGNLLDEIKMREGNIRKAEPEIYNKYFSENLPLIN